MEYFFYCRGRPGTEALADELAEAHWSFMDGYAEQMIARGPTLTPDRTTWTGSMHMVDLPDAQAARVFAFQEPFYRAGVYGEVLVRRWGNALGRTMWDYPAEPGDDRRFLVIGRGKPGVEAARQALEANQRRLSYRPQLQVLEDRLAPAISITSGTTQAPAVTSRIRGNSQSSTAMPIQHRLANWLVCRKLA